MAVPVREFKSHLARYLREVRAGRTFEITSRRKVIAKVIPVPEAPRRGLQRLLAAGAARWSGGKPEGLGAVTLTEGGTPVSHIVLEDRG